MKVKEIALPKETKDLRIHHYAVIQNRIYQGGMDLALKIDFLSDFTGVHKNELRKIDLVDIYKMYGHCVDIITGYKPQEPPLRIEIDGVWYKRIDPFTVSSGWHMDFEKTDVKRDFVRLACLFYYPEGSDYGDTDKNSNLLHPIAERYETFRKEFPLSIFLDASAFFLNKYKRSIDRYTVSQRLRMKLKRIPFVSRLIGKGL